jgi:hypothetical protein
MQFFRLTLSEIWSGRTMHFFKNPAKNMTPPKKENLYNSQHSLEIQNIFDYLCIIQFQSLIESLKMLHIYITVSKTSCWQKT